MTRGDRERGRSFAGYVTTALATIMIGLFCAGPAGADETRAAAIAEQLAQRPVSVHESLDSVLPPEEQDALVERIEASPVPVFVVVEPLVVGDTWSGEGQQLLSAVHERLGQDGEYLTRNPNGRLVGATFGTAGRAAEQAATVVSENDAALTTTEEFERAVDLLANEEAGSAFQEHLEREAAELDAEESSEVADASSPGSLPLIGGAVAILASVIGGVFVVSRVRVARRTGAGDIRRTRSVPSQATFDNARESLDAIDTQRLHQDLITIGRRVAEAAPKGADEGTLAAHKSAVDHYQAAGKVLDVADSPLHRAGARFLLDRALAALTDPAESPAHCFFDPTHPRADDRVDWRAAGDSRSVSVHACDRCGQAVRRHLPPRSLMVRHNGETVPYFTVPAAESVWSATGFGSHSDDLPHRILRGDPLG